MMARESQFAMIQQSPTGSTVPSSISMTKYDKFKDPGYLKQALGSFITPSEAPPTFTAPPITLGVRSAQELGMKPPTISIPTPYRTGATPQQIAAEKAAIRGNLARTGAKVTNKQVEAAFTLNMQNYAKTAQEAQTAYQKNLASAQALSPKLPPVAKAPVIGTPTATEQQFEQIKSGVAAAPNEQAVYEMAAEMVLTRYRYDQAVSNAMKAYNEYLSQYQQIASSI